MTIPEGERVLVGEEWPEFEGVVERDPMGYSGLRTERGWDAFGYLDKFWQRCRICKDTAVPYGTDRPLCGLACAECEADAQDDYHRYRAEAGL